MTYPTYSLNERRRPTFAARLRDITRQLEAIEEKMANHGLVEESQSLATVAADLRWQEEMLVSREEE